MNEQRNLYLAIGISIAIIIFFQILLPTQPIEPPPLNEEETLEPATSIDGKSKPLVEEIKSKELELKYEHRIPIKLHIQSMGGELMPTFYVCDLIRNLETPVHVYIDGFVASAAATIAVCGHKRFMTKHSSMLVHQLKSSSSGKFAELKDEMSNLNMFMMNLEDIYLENTKIDKDELEKLLFSEIWLPSDKCLEYGLVDAII